MNFTCKTHGEVPAGCSLCLDEVSRENARLEEYKEAFHLTLAEQFDWVGVTSLDDGQIGAAMCWLRSVRASTEELHGYDDVDREGSEYVLRLIHEQELTTKSHDSSPTAALEAEVASLKAPIDNEEVRKATTFLKEAAKVLVRQRGDLIGASGLEKAADLLRSQARRIAEHQKQVEQDGQAIKELHAEVGRLHQRIQSLERRTEKADELASAAQALDALDTPSANERYEIALAAYKDSVNESTRTAGGK